VKIFWTLCLIYFAIAAYGMGAQKPIQVSGDTVTVEIPSTYEPQDYLSIRKCTNCSDSQWKFIQEAQVKTNETVASSCFASFMIQRKFIDIDQMSNSQVVEALVGKNTLTDVEMYRTAKRVLGYTLANQPVGKYKIWINSRYMMKWNRCDLGSLLGHETAHKKGFKHSFKYTKSRIFSVPYSMNEAIDQCCVRSL
jgi:hypothetical protein